MSVWQDKETGKWNCKLRYTDYTGQRIQKKKIGFTLKRDAEKWERDYLSKVTGSPSMPFSALCDLYLEDKKAHTKKITYNTKKNRIDKWIRPYFENVPVNKIDAASIRSWQTDIKTTATDTGKEPSPGYLQNIVTELSSIFNFAVRFYGLSVNPAHVAGNSVGKKQKSMSFWTYKQFQQFINTFDQNDPYYTAFMVLYFTGLRKGELFALTPADIDLAKGAINVSKTLNVIDGKTVITSPKTAKSTRTVVIPAFLCEILKVYESRFYDLQKDFRIFQCGKTTLQNQLSKHATLAGVPRIRVHDLRHSHASHLIEMGFSALLVSERLGHDSVNTTLQVYAHLYPSKQTEVAERLQNLFEEKK